MTKTEMINTVKTLGEWEVLLTEAQAQVEFYRDQLKAEMTERDVEELDLGEYIIRWTSILSNRFDSTAFKKEHGDLYKQFTKQTASRRFTIS